MLTQRGNYDVKHFLLYYYYGGMIYTAIKNYDRAQYFLRVCITTPALAVSHIMLEAFKKYILVSLILEGKHTESWGCPGAVTGVLVTCSAVTGVLVTCGTVTGMLVTCGPSRAAGDLWYRHGHAGDLWCLTGVLIGKIPKYASLVVTRFIKPLSQVYWDLGQAFATNCPDKVCGVINKNQETFTGDQNMGLVKQCLSALYKKNIQRLTRTFLTLSLGDVANRVQLATPQEAQKYILNMIDDGEIHASINQRDGMVVFLDNPERYNSPDMMAQLDKECDEFCSTLPSLPSGAITALQLLSYIHNKQLKELYPNLWITLRIVCTLPVTVASAERSFSKLKLIKTYLRSSMGQNRLSGLSIISINQEIGKQLTYDEVINDFASNKARRQKF
ncbi:COP9 signalosome complex subunit 3 [Chionoecetes opilio]|uniref:COP9 signalosome complex subunit 3 n=1 Tax=Chionoecetes opilio TaxID=41210 RepID=A0A8J4YWX3_CHIOP|nr:COP9 signalosome complex subunit 3 [Chionoecetes opilio]